MSFKLSQFEKRWLDKMNLELEKYRLDELTLKDINEGKIIWSDKLQKFVDAGKFNVKNKKKQNFYF